MVVVVVVVGTGKKEGKTSEHFETSGIKPSQLVGSLAKLQYRGMNQ